MSERLGSNAPKLPPFSTVSELVQALMGREPLLLVPLAGISDAVPANFGTLRQHRIFMGPGVVPVLPGVTSGIIFGPEPRVIDLKFPFELGVSSLYVAADWEAHHAGGLPGLVEVVSRLLEPEKGCPWDLKQTHESLRKYLIEEAYELCDAIENNDRDGMKEELGDVLLQPLMHAEIARRDGNWTNLNQIAHATAEKLVRRHPHVFGDLSVADADEVLKNWDAIKKTEKGKGILEGIPRAMPALTRALAISKRAARSGFEWPHLAGVWDKLVEECNELEEALSGGDPDEIQSELGDLLFTVVNLARWAEIDPEEALRTMLDRFTRRFETMEALAEKPLSELDADEWDALWNEAKRV